MATNKSINQAISSENFENAVAHLYSAHNLPDQRLRYAELLKKHKKSFDGDCTVFSSSGRIEVIGNHTDHNCGKVLTAAISVDTLAIVSPNMDGIIRICSGGYPMLTVRAGDTAVTEEEKGTSLALVKGVANWFKQHDYNIGGFFATVTSDVFKGAGVSSSASFEVLVAEIFNVLYNKGRVTKMEKAIASQYAENVYFGKPCGLMDQSAIALGGISAIDFKDTASPVVENFEWPFDGVEIILVNAGGDHSNLTPNYAAIRSEMEEVAECFGHKVLRDIPKAEFMDQLAVLKKKVSGRAILRALHYFEENERIDTAVTAIKNKDLASFIDAVNRSGESSYTLLQNCYPESDHEQHIPVALAVSKRFDGVLATRVHGGGFAGTILSIVKKDSSDAYFEYMKSLFGEQNIYRLVIRDSGATQVIL